MKRTCMGVPVLANPFLVVTAEDWSKVRSPGRARRRMRRGFKQNITVRTVADPKVYMLGGVCHMHPEHLAKLEKQLRVGSI